MAIPDRSTARRLLDDEGLPDGIVVHSTGVARVAVAAAGLVAEARVPVDGALVEAAALLHDIDKVEIRRTGGTHGIVGARRLEAMGYEELAMPVASHPITCLVDDDRFPIGWPSVLVAVADRHVAQRFLTVDERLDDMKARHPEHAESIESARRPAHALEAELAAVTGLSVDDLVQRLRVAWEAGA
ncbi:MAG TPA: HDIG domain-containing protein [Candidatus Binatia bacterium]|nr:HDIG domain-containing protein [Candidatus Binatia bacterium]